MPKDIKY